MGHDSTGGVEVGRDAFCGNGEGGDSYPQSPTKKSVHSNKKPPLPNAEIQATHPPYSFGYQSIMNRPSKMNATPAV